MRLAAANSIRLSLLSCLADVYTSLLRYCYVSASFPGAQELVADFPSADHVESQRRIIIVYILQYIGIHCGDNSRNNTWSSHWSLEPRNPNPMVISGFV